MIVTVNTPSVGNRLATIANDQFRISIYLNDRKHGSCFGLDEIAFVMGNRMVAPVVESKYFSHRV
jgi:hypothetical protein